jgi:hypothetical protein
MEFFRLRKRCKAPVRFVLDKITRKIISLFLRASVKATVDLFMSNALNNGLTVKLRKKWLELSRHTILTSLNAKFASFHSQEWLFETISNFK